MGISSLGLNKYWPKTVFILFQTFSTFLSNFCPALHINFTLIWKDCLLTLSSCPLLSSYPFHRWIALVVCWLALWKNKKSDYRSRIGESINIKQFIATTNLVNGFVSTIVKAVTMAELRRSFKSHTLWTTKTLVHQAKLRELGRWDYLISFSSGDFLLCFKQYRIQFEPFLYKKTNSYEYIYIYM